MPAWTPSRRTGVITVSMLAKIQRMHFRDGVQLRDISRRTGLSRNTIRRWLREPPSTGEPKYQKRASSSVVDPWSEQLRLWLFADTRRPKRERRSAKKMHVDCALQASTAVTTAFVRLSATGNKTTMRALCEVLSYRSPSSTARHSSSTEAANTSSPPACDGE